MNERLSAAGRTLQRAGNEHPVAVGMVVAVELVLLAVIVAAITGTAVLSRLIRLVILAAVFLPINIALWRYLRRRDS
jgi:hypothetical protein